jgi:ribosomal protein S18 acetylase RimI-like enzyme
MSMLVFEPATAAELPFLRTMIIDSFEPITWYKKIDLQFGALEGLDWRARWELRVDKIFETQILLTGKRDGEIVAAATGLVDSATGLGFVDLLAVAAEHKGKGYGRLMLRAMLDHFRALGMHHAHLECLTDNDRGNALYGSEGWQIVASSHHWFTKL